VSVPQTPRLRARPAPIGRALAALVGMELRLSLRRAENLLVTAVIPAAVLLFFATTGILAVPGRAVDFLLPGSIALAIIATGLVSLGIATAYERHYGVLKRLGGAPLPRWALAVARTSTVLLTEAAQIVLLVGVAWIALGWRPPSSLNPALALVGVLLGTAAFAGLGLAMAGRFRAEAVLALANGLFLVLLLVGGIVVPVDHLPEPVAALAGVLPAAPLSEVLRIAFGGLGDAGPPLLLLTVWASVSAALGVRGFRWE
jgi:ABC-2 type transport system permease protein